MTAMRAGNVVVAAQRFAYADGDRFLADIQMRQTRHLGAEIKLIDLFFEQTDLQHLAIEVNPAFVVNRGRLVALALAFLVWPSRVVEHLEYDWSVGVMEKISDLSYPLLQYSITPFTHSSPPPSSPALQTRSQNLFPRALWRARS